MLSNRAWISSIIFFCLFSPSLKAQSNKDLFKLGELSNEAWRKGDYALAYQYQREKFDLIESSSKKDKAYFKYQKFASLGGMANARKVQGLFEESDSLSQLSIAYGKKLLNEGNPHLEDRELIIVKCEMAELYLQMGAYERALTLLFTNLQYISGEEYAAIIFGDNLSLTKYYGYAYFQNLRAMTQALLKLNKLPEALDKIRYMLFLKRSMDLAHQNDDQDRINYMKAEIGALLLDYRIKKRISTAFRNGSHNTIYGNSDYDKYLLVLENYYGTNHPYFVTYLNNYLKDLVINENKTEKASRLISTYKLKFNSHNKASRAQLTFMEGMINAKLNKTEKAINFYQEGLNALFEFYDYNSYFLSLDEKRNFWNTVKNRLNEFNVLAYAYLDLYPDKQAQLLPTMITYQLRSKGKSLENILELKRRILESSNDSLTHSYKRLLKCKRKYIAIASDKTLKATETLHLLSQEINELERRLFKMVSKINPSRYDYQDLRKSLNPNEAVLEIIRVSVTKTAVENLEVPLSSAEKKMSLRLKNQTGRGLKRFKKTTVYYDSIFYVGISIYNDNLKYTIIQNGKNLEGDAFNYYKNGIKLRLKDSSSYKNFYKSFLRHIPSHVELYVCPDGVYNLVNMNAIFDAENQKYLFESYTINNISSLKYFFNRGRYDQKRGNSEIYLYGRPTFDNQQLLDSLSMEQRAIMDFFNGKISDLPGTENEVQDIEKIFQVDHTVRKFLGAAASEESIQTIKNPLILHIATHGYFVRKDTGSLVRRIDQMLNSGLLLSDVLSTDTAVDGVLTAEEASMLDLENTELVVLSACQTGLGTVEEGEGVYGLQRGFLVAGAKNLIMSMWNIDDAVTSLFMNEFYNRYYDQNDIQEAFTYAMGEIKERYPSPYYWGAFVLMRG